jgi:hypothetical protein
MLLALAYLKKMSEGIPYIWFNLHFSPLAIAAPGLSKNAFLRAQQFVFQHTGADEDKLRSEFRILGYNARCVPAEWIYMLIPCYSGLAVYCICSVPLAGDALWSMN